MPDEILAENACKADWMVECSYHFINRFMVKHMINGALIVNRKPVYPAG